MKKLISNLFQKNMRKKYCYLCENKDDIWHVKDENKQNS